MPSGTKTEKLFSLKTQLTGQDNYTTWTAVMKRMLKALGTYEITVEGVKPKEGKPTEVIATFNQQDNSAATAILQVVSDDILVQISEFDSSFAMWTYLRQQYLRESAYSFVAQIQNLISLAEQLSLLLHQLPNLSLPSSCNGPS